MHLKFSSQALVSFSSHSCLSLRWEPRDLSNKAESCRGGGPRLQSKARTHVSLMRGDIHRFHCVDLLTGYQSLGMTTLTRAGVGMSELSGYVSGAHDWFICLPVQLMWRWWLLFSLSWRVKLRHSVSACVGPTHKMHVKHPLIFHAFHKHELKHAPVKHKQMMN